MANEYLQRTPTSSGNKKVFTISAWTKINGTNNANTLCNSHGNASSFLTIRVSTNGDTNSVLVYSIKSGTDYSRYWNLADRDCSSWIHHVFAFDTTAANVDDRVIYYRNGVKITSYSDVYGSIPQNYEFDIITSRSFDIFRNVDQSTYGKGQIFDYFFVDGQALTPDVFGFYKDGDGYMSSGTPEATDFRPGQWVPHAPRVIKKSIERRGGFGVNGLYLPLNDSSNPGADFHCAPNSMIKLKGEDLPQPQNGAPTTSDAFVSQLRQETGTLGFDGAIKFDGDGDYLSLTGGDDLAFGTGDFTVECFIYPTGIPNDDGIFESRNGTVGATDGFTLTAFSSNVIRVFAGSVLITASTSSAPYTGRWTHVAVTRSSGTLNLFINGKSQGTSTASLNMTNQDCIIGGGRYQGSSSIPAASTFNGLISNFRAVKGTAVYTANFTPPTEPLTNITNTKLLCCNSTKAPESATVAPTIGTYVQNWTENTSSGLDSYNGIGAIYDGQLGTSNRGGNSSSHDGSYETLFDGQSVAVSSTIDIYWNGVGSGQRVIRVNGTTEINGGSGALTPGWDSHSFSGTVTKLEVKTANTGSYGISAVRIDSNILTTPLTSNGDVFATRNELTGSMVLAVPGISTATGSNLITNGNFDSTDITSWTTTDNTQSWNNGQLQINRSGGGGATSYQTFTTEVGKRYTVTGTVNSSGSRGDLRIYDGTGFGGTLLLNFTGTSGQTTTQTGSFTAASATTSLGFSVDNNSTTIYVDNIVVKQEDAPRDYSADIKGSGTNKTLTPNGGAGVGYELGNYYGSGMTFDGSGDYFTVPASSDLDFGTGDFTAEFWLYSDSSNTSAYRRWLTTTSGAFSSGTWVIRENAGGSDKAIGGNVVATGANAFQRGQWNHIAWTRYGTTETIYVNGVSVVTVTNSTTNYNEGATNGLYIGGFYSASNNEYFDGQIQDIRVYKGIAKYKGGFDVPKPYTPIGIEAFRTTADTCKNNFPTLNPLFTFSTSNVSYSDGNLFADTSTNDRVVQANMAFTSGKWYWETRIYNDEMIGIAVAGANMLGYPGRNINALSYHRGGAVYDSNTNTSYGAGWTYNTYHIIGIAVDKDNNQVYWSVDGVWANGADPVAGTNGWNVLAQNATRDVGAHVTAAWRVRSGTNGEQVSVNFGQNPSFSGKVTAGTFTDDSGKGLFKYAPPTGFLALCEDNLPTPAIADPGEHFKTVLWDGDGNGGRSITGVGFQPDLVWVKRRSASAIHFLFDSVRGAGKYLQSSANADEGDDATNTLMSFDSDGFTSGNTAGMNGSSHQYVAWCWKAGGPAVTNNEGSITAQVSANPTAGFSIATYSGGAGTVGHGLGKKPSLIIEKKRGTTGDWLVTTDVIDGSMDYLRLNHNLTAAAAAISAPTSTVFTPNIGSSTVVAYIWAEIEGFSKFGRYVGNANADGTFVYCGFKPAWVMVKITTGSNNSWVIYDSSRNSTNMVNNRLRADLTNEEDSHNGVDFLSNGFKLRDAGSSSTNAAQTYLFMAFAESPFQTANAK